jgi:hypothetical protein
MTMLSLIEVEAHEFSHPSVADLKGLSQDNIMNDYDNRQLIGRASACTVNDHDKRASETRHIDAYRYMLKQKGVYDAGKETFKRTSEKHLKNFQSRTPSKKYSDKKSDLALRTACGLRQSGSLKRRTKNAQRHRQLSCQNC